LLLIYTKYPFFQLGDPVFLERQRLIELAIQRATE